ncbi:hypothetical protein ABIB08_007873 [Bradyrhizobium sp. RT11b]
MGYPAESDCYFRATPLSCQALENPIILLRRMPLSLELKRRRLGITYPSELGRGQGLTDSTA